MDNGSLEEHDTIVKCDDCSTTDSGSALDDESCQGTEIPSTINGQEDNYQDEDEGGYLLISRSFSEFNILRKFCSEIITLT